MKGLRGIGIITIILGALVTLGVMLSTTSFGSSISDILVALGFYVWVILPFAVLLFLTSFIHRKGHSPAARVAILITSVLVVVSSVLMYWAATFDSDSSTSALVFVFVPFYALVAIGVVYLLAWLLARLLMPKPYE